MHHATVGEAANSFRPNAAEMISQLFQPTPDPDINALLRELLSRTQAILGTHFLGSYLTGSLALGDFQTHCSDVDLVIVTHASVSDDLFAALREMHGRLANDCPPWGAKLEAVYLPLPALREGAPAGANYPVLEKGGVLEMAPLEDAWSVQCYTLREHGVALAGPEPGVLLAAVDPNRMRRESSVVAGTWLREALTDPTWLEWLRQRENQAFVVVTLCRLLYTLEVGTVASKPGAARWARQTLEPRWSVLIERAVGERPDSEEIHESEEAATLAFVRYTVDRFRQWETAAP